VRTRRRRAATPVPDAGRESAAWTSGLRPTFAIFIPGVAPASHRHLLQPGTIYLYTEPRLGARDELPVFDDSGAWQLDPLGKWHLTRREAELPQRCRRERKNEVLIRSISRSPGSTATLRPSRTLRWIKRPWCNDHGSSPGLFTVRLRRKHIST